MNRIHKYCNCSEVTPKNIRARRWECPFHRYLRYGEALYAVAGKRIKFANRFVGGEQR